MTDEKALLSAIWENPHEDTPRLVYADWLQENGQPERAEFIRVQCELARTDMHDPRRTTLEQRAGQLFTLHSTSWTHGTPGYIRRIQNARAYDRGFPQPKRELNVHLFPTLDSDQWSAAPLWKIDFTIQKPKHRDIIAECVNSPNLLRVGELSLGGFLVSPELRWRPGDVVNLVRSPSSRNLSKLSIDRNQVGSELVEALSDPASLPHLGYLSLKGSNLTAGALVALAGLPAAARLQSLDISGNGLGDTGMEVLASLPPFPALRELRVGANGVTAAGFSALANWSGLSDLYCLHLGSHHEMGFGFTERLTTEIARAFVDSPYLTRLWSLYYPEFSGSIVHDMLKERFKRAYAC